MQINSIPRWPEDVNVETWSRGIGKLTAYRDYIIWDCRSKEAAKGTATWVVVDTEKRKIQRLEELSAKWPSNSDKSAIGKSADKVQELRDHVAGKYFAVKYSDLDVNRHVNNVKYIEWIMDGYTMDFIESKEIKKFEINFIGETNYGDDVAVNAERLSEEPLVFLNNVVKKSDGRDICRARIEFK